MVPSVCMWSIIEVGSSPFLHLLKYSLLGREAQHKSCSGLSLMHLEKLQSEAITAGFSAKEPISPLLVP